MATAPPGRTGRRGRGPCDRSCASWRPARCCGASWTSYQIAIKIDAARPAIRQALGSEIGGTGTGAHNSFSQYLGRELSGRIKGAQEAGEQYPVEGAFLSNEHVTALTYRDTHNHAIASSLTGTGLDLALFRLRDGNS
jgi:hypothetical protein